MINIFDNETNELIQQTESNKMNINDDDDDIIKKLKNIPILPRIPKRKSQINLLQEDTNNDKLEHKSVLDQRQQELSCDQWKSSGWSSSSSSSTVSKNLNNRNIKNRSTSIKVDRTALQKNMGTNSVKRSCELMFDDMINGKTDNVPVINLANEPSHPLSSNKHQAHRMAKNKLTKPNICKNASPSGNNKKQKSEKAALDSLGSIVDFECFESRWTDGLPRAPCKSLEDRVRERMQMKQPPSSEMGFSSSNNDCQTNQAYSTNTSETISESRPTLDTTSLANKIFDNHDDVDNLDNSDDLNQCHIAANDLNTFVQTNSLNIPSNSDSLNSQLQEPQIFDLKNVDRIIMPPPTMPPPTSKNILRRKKVANKNPISQGATLNGESKPLWGKITKEADPFSSINISEKSEDINSQNGRKVTFKCPEIKRIQPNDHQQNHKSKNREKSESRTEQQALAVTAMKQLLKPLYKRQKVNKQQYKDIMRLAVSKLSQSLDGTNRNKIVESGKQIITTYLREEKIVKKTCS